MRPVHPGEVLREDYLKPLRMSANALAKALGVPAPHALGFDLNAASNHPVTPTGRLAASGTDVTNGSTPIARLMTDRLRGDRLILVIRSSAPKA
jgi:hypothetical protein